MGCATSKNVNKANKDVYEQRKTLFGLHMSKNPDGIETISNLPSKEKQKKLTKSQMLKKKKTVVIKEEE